MLNVRSFAVVVVLSIGYGCSTSLEKIATRLGAAQAYNPVSSGSVLGLEQIGPGSGDKVITGELEAKAGFSRVVAISETVATLAVTFEKYIEVDIGAKLDAKGAVTLSGITVESLKDPYPAVSGAAFTADANEIETEQGKTFRVYKTQLRAAKISMLDNSVTKLGIKLKPDAALVAQLQLEDAALAGEGKFNSLLFQKGKELVFGVTPASVRVKRERKSFKGSRGTLGNISIDIQEIATTDGTPHRFKANVTAAGKAKEYVGDFDQLIEILKMDGAVYYLSVHHNGIADHDFRIDRYTTSWVNPK